MKNYKYNVTIALVISIIIGCTMYMHGNKNKQINSANEPNKTTAASKAAGDCKRCNKWVASSGVPAMLCNDCGFGNKKDNCVACDKWVGSTKIAAQLCSDCGFGSKKDNCAKCNKWMGSTKIEAKLCNDCGFGSKKDNCAKCK
ncbi:MAG: hypothetical protein JNJ41_15055 [Bacteroidia bacterium]|nr:hypothetical protein [Bacteroidia bacterium]